MSRAGESRDEPLVYGPKMLELQDRQRRFVEALFVVDVAPGKSRLVAAAKEAGYECKDEHTIHVSGNRLMRDPKVAAAIAEHYGNVTKTLAPKVYAAIERIIDDAAHPDHAKFVLALAERLDPTPRGPTVHVETHNHLSMSCNDMLDQIRHLATKHGMDPAVLLGRNFTPSLIDAAAVQTDGSAESQKLRP